MCLRVAADDAGYFFARECKLLFSPNIDLLPSKRSCHLPRGLGFMWSLSIVILLLILFVKGVIVPI